MFNDHQSLSRIIDARRGTGRLRIIHADPITSICQASLPLSPGLMGTSRDRVRGAEETGTEHFEPGEATAQASLRQDPQGLRVTLPGGEHLELLDGRGDDHILECNLAPQQLTQAWIKGQIEKVVNRGAPQVGIDEQSSLTTPGQAGRQMAGQGCFSFTRQSASQS